MKRLAHWIWLGVLVTGCGADARPRVDDLDVPGGGTAGHQSDDSAGAGGAGAGGAGAGAAGLEGGSGDAEGGRGGGTEGGNAGAAGTAGAAGAEAELAPLVTIAAPTEALHPDDGAVLADSVLVLCSAVAPSGGDPVDDTAVMVELINAEGDVLQSVPADATREEGVYEAEFVVANHPSGAVSIECTASTQGAESYSTTATVQQFIDHGPIITPIVPLQDEARLARDTVMQFLVEPSPLAEDDTGAEVSAVGLQVNGVTFELTPTGASNTYEALVPFEDTSVFDPMPAGSVPVLVTATNSRTPEGVTAELPYTFILDGSGPAITIAQPAPLSVVGGEVTLEFAVQDDYSGVAEDTLRVLINATDPESGQRYSPTSPAWSQTAGTFRFSFDSAAVEGSNVQMTVNITVNDGAGNAAETASVLYYIDNEPPYVSLDPPDVRDVTRSGTEIRCTHPFDPVGDGAVSDLETWPLIAHFRAFALDRTNQTEGQTIFYYSTVDVERTQLFLATDNGAPFIIDSNDDGMCDAISGDGLALPQQELMPIDPKGDEPEDTLESLDPERDPAVDVTATTEDPYFFCTADTNGAILSLCGGSSDLWRATSQRIAGESLPAVYAIGVTDGSGAACSGSQWDLDPYVDAEGWVCLAAVAYDYVGNRGVSAPLRVCLDDPTDSVYPGCATGEVPAPACTDGCIGTGQHGPDWVRPTGCTGECTRMDELSIGERLLEQF